MGSAPTQNKIEFQAMGCRMSACLDSQDPQARDLLEEVPAWFEEWEEILSRFRPDSELSVLNARPGEWVRVSPVLWSVFQAARIAYRESGGLVNPLTLNALEQAGYSRSFEELGSLQAGGGHGAPVPDLDLVEEDPTEQALRLPPGVRLDFGGIAKGWSAHLAALQLSTLGPSLVDAGGDIAITGVMADGSPWPVGVINPFRPEIDLELLGLGRCGIATSGRDYRRWKQGDAWRHHIIHPHTGLPAKTDVLSATVIARTALEAEAAAKAVLILGGEAGLDWLEVRPDRAGLLVLEDGTRLYGRGMDSFLWS